MLHHSYTPVLALLFLLLCTLPAACQSEKQKPAVTTVPNVQEDMTQISPGTVRIIAKVISLDGQNTSLLKAEIVEVLGEGSGIVNPLSKGQQLIISNLTHSSSGLVALGKGDVFKADVRESMGLNQEATQYNMYSYQLINKE